ncbi:MAG TPA: ADP-forming succinate--CoA ligase subunit beta [Desulfobacteraceae bacterium]|nr:ADP-forming succinate--CoA ligase subunit beta [Desulfobacteraceae bacterium]
MKLHEYQAKELFNKWNIPVPAGVLITDEKSAVEKIQSMNSSPPWVVKAQVHAGGRGKAGGVQLVSSKDEAVSAISRLLGGRLVTHQTGPEGAVVRKVLLEEGLAIEREFYLSVTIDRSAGRPIVIFSPSGGMDIEALAASTPELIFREHVDPSLGWMPYQTRNIAYRIEPLPEAGVIRQIGEAIRNLYNLFISCDCSLVEINPLVTTSSGRIVAADAKLDVDNNALFRQKQLASIYDYEEMDPLEREAGEFDLSYIRLDGSVGCMVNGAGLAMATMDVIQAAGASPANFLDVGGGAGEEKIGRGLEIILSDKHVKAVLINIFGGILRCDLLAKGVCSAASKVSVDLPMIVRLRGTNAEEGAAILKESGLRFRVAGDLAEAAALVQEVVGEN